MAEVLEQISTRSRIDVETAEIRSFIEEGRR